MAAEAVAGVSEQVDVQQLRELLDKATPGPWKLERSTGDELNFVGIEWDARGWWAKDSTLLTEPNAALIVAAVNGLPGLLARLDALEEENERLRKKVGDVES